MYKFSLLIILSAACLHTAAQSIIRGTVTDETTHRPLEGATVTLLPLQLSALTNENGQFLFKGIFGNDASIQVNSIGYALQTFTLADLQKTGVLSLWQKQILLEDVLVTASAGNQYKLISKTDIAMRGITNSQEVLRIIPGIVIGQHQGGGKAEQIFLRGFDCDHGTDFRLDVDGLPINMVSHAHGQGFADSHFSTLR